MGSRTTTPTTPGTPVIPVTPVTLAMVSILVAAGLGALGWSLEPENAVHWARRMFGLPALWGFLEFAQYRGQDRSAAARGVMRWHRLMVAGLGLMMTMDMGFELAISTDLLGAHWARTGQSIQGVFFGAGLAIWGNFLPTVASPWSLAEQPFDWQRVHRFVGWIAALSGIALMAVWLSLPMEEARAASAWIIGPFVVLSLGRKLVSLLAAGPRTSPA